MKQTTDEALPRAPAKINGKIKCVDDELINALSERRLKLTRQAHYSQGKANKDKKRLRERRGKVFKKIRYRIQALNEERVTELANEMESSIVWPRELTPEEKRLTRGTKITFSETKGRKTWFEVHTILGMI